MSQTTATGSQNTQNSLKGSWSRCSESKTSRMLDPGFAHKLCHSRRRLLTVLGNLTL